MHNSIDNLELSTRVSNILKRTNITTIEQLVKIFANKDKKHFMLGFRGMGQTAYDEIRGAITSYFSRTENADDMSISQLHEAQKQKKQKSEEIKSKIQTYYDSIEKLNSELKELQMQQNMLSFQIATKEHVNNGK